MIHARPVSGNPSPAQREGFTLIELSIVLVIIGLLIGGILVGQSLMESATTFKYVRELQSFKVSYDGFVAVFKQKPGDFSRRIEMFGGGTNGNGNGLIDWYSEAPSLNEPTNFWQDLRKFNYPDMDKSFTIGGYMIRNKKPTYADGEFYYAYHGDFYPTFNDSGLNQETSITLANFKPASSINAVSLNASSLKAIDNKADDGLPYSGKIRGHRGVPLEAGFTPTVCSQSVAGINEYKVDVPTKNCRLIFLLERY